MTSAHAQHSWRPPMDRQRLVRWFFFITLVVLLHQTARIFLSFYLPLLAAGLLAMALYPTHERLLRLLPSRPTAAAASTTLGAGLLVILPLCGMGWIFFRETAKVAPVARAWLDGLGDWQTRGLSAFSGGRLGAWLAAWHVEPRELLLKNLEALGGQTSGWAAALVRNLIAVALDSVALVCLLFVLLRDGPRLLRTLISLIPLPSEDKETLRSKVTETTVGVVRGAFGVAALQGLLTGIGLAVLSIPFPVLLGTLTAVASPIPVVGTGVILTPVVLGLYVSGATTKAALFTLWSLIAVHGIDGFLRPIWLSKYSNQPSWLVFFGIMGGLKLYGFSGVLIGPVIVTLALSFASIYRREYAELLEKR